MYNYKVNVVLSCTYTCNIYHYFRHQINVLSLHTKLYPQLSECL